MTAKILTVNFSKVPDIVEHASGVTQGPRPSTEAPTTADGKLLTPKQIRARARRKMKRMERMTDQEFSYLYSKPIDEWDLDELAHGRPRNSEGRFSGPKPKWITTAIHEEAMTRYTSAVKSRMNATTVDALDVIKQLINDDERDDKGKPIVPAGTKLEAAKFLIEHVVGKPTQRLEQDVSVKLQGILGQVMVNPAEVLNGHQTYELGHLPGITIPLGVEEDAGSDDDELLDSFSG